MLFIFLIYIYPYVPPWICAHLMHADTYGGKREVDHLGLELLVVNGMVWWVGTRHMVSERTIHSLNLRLVFPGGGTLLCFLKKYYLCLKYKHWPHMSDQSPGSVVSLWAIVHTISGWYFKNKYKAISKHIVDFQHI